MPAPPAGLEPLTIWRSLIVVWEFPFAAIVITVPLPPPSMIVNGALPMSGVPLMLIARARVVQPPGKVPAPIETVAPIGAASMASWMFV